MSFLYKSIKRTATNGILNIFVVENKRTYTQRITFSGTVNFHINRTHIGTFTNVVEVTPSLSIPNAEVITVNGNYAIKWLSSAKSYTVNVDVDGEYEIMYIVDIKSKKKRAQTQPQTVNGEADPNSDTSLKVETAKWIERQVMIASRIYAEVQKSMNNPEYIKLDEASRLKYYQNRFSNFNRQHPICLRYIVDHQKFNTKAMTKYLQKVATSKWGDQDAFIQRQADYITLLYKEMVPNWNPEVAKKIWKDSYDTIKEDSDTFKLMQNTADELAEVVESKYINEMRSELLAQLTEMRNTKDQSLLGLSPLPSPSTENLSDDDVSSSDEESDDPEIDEVYKSAW